MPPSNNRRRFPDEAHESLATWVEETISDLRANKADVADGFLLVDTLFQLSDGARNDIGYNSADLGDALLLVDTLFALLNQAATDMAALTARVAALEQPLP